MPIIKKIAALAEGIPGCVSLAQGALRLGGVDQQTKEYVRHLLLSDVADYYSDPLGLPLLRERLAQTLSQQWNASVTPQHIAISHGGVGALTALALTVLNPGDEVLLPEPMYPTYVNITKLAKATPTFVHAYELISDKESNVKTWTFNVEAVKSAVTNKTKMIILSSPSNPTGCCLSAQDLKELSVFCESREIYLVMDEVYDDYVFRGTFASSTPHAVQSHYTVRIGSFSKNFGMSGWRIGYAVAHPKLITTLGAVQGSIIANPTVIAQHAVIHALEHRENIARYAAVIKKNCEAMCDFFDVLEQHKIISYAHPQAGFYLFFKIENADSTAFVMDVLQQAKVALVPGTDFGPSAQQYVRLCFSRDPSLITESITRLKNYFSAKHPGLFNASEVPETH